jgi:hypothetical protein
MDCSSSPSQNERSNYPKAPARYSYSFFQSSYPYACEADFAGPVAATEVHQDCALYEIHEASQTRPSKTRKVIGIWFTAEQISFANQRSFSVDEPPVMSPFHFAGCGPIVSETRVRSLNTSFRRR